MTSIAISAENFTIDETGNTMLPLGSTENNLFNPNLVSAKMMKQLPQHLDSLWGAIGIEDNNNKFWQGKVNFSENGNLLSTGATAKQIKMLKQSKVAMGFVPDKRVIERVINFDDVSFNFEEQKSYEDHPLLKLTVFVKHDEEALVYYELYDGEYNPNKIGEIEYILPEVHVEEAQDRYIYFFNALPKGKIIDGKLVPVFQNEEKQSFIVKVIISQKPTQTHLLAKSKSLNIANIFPQKEHKLLLYLPTEGKFIDTNGNTDIKIQTDIKTLLLIHGTFVDTAASFEGMIQPGINNSIWLNELIGLGKYKQVIALDHPTVTADAKDNAEALISLLNGSIFLPENPVTIITTSRGGLVGKYLINSAAMQQIIPIDKAVFIAGANGVNYFTAGKRINAVGKLLSVFASAAPAVGPVAAGIIKMASMSIDTFLNMPGCRQMTIDDPLLNNVLNGIPVLSTVEIYPIADDWDKILSNDNKWIKRMATRGLDAVIKRVIFSGGDNDWVVATANQSINPPNSKPVFYSKSMHTKVLYEGKSNLDIKKQLLQIL